METTTGTCAQCGTENTDLYQSSCCGEMICENCFEPYTIHTQVEGRCKACADGYEARRFTEAMVEHERQEAKRESYKKAAATRRVNYWKPENVEKRRLKKLQLQKEREELHQRQMKELGDVMRDFLRFF